MPTGVPTLGAETMHWDEVVLPPIRHEAAFGDRVVRCFAERPRSLAAMWTRAAAERGAHDALVFDDRCWRYAQAEVEVGRIAAALQAHGLDAGDRAVTFVGRPCPVLGERVRAVVHAPGIAHDGAALSEHCRARLADHKVPETFSWCGDPLPRNANGKLLKCMLRERILGSNP